MRARSRSRRPLVEGLESRVAPGTYVVAPGGRDSAAGSSSAPWRTLQHAARVVGPGDTVRVRAGNYAGFHLTTGGNASAPIRFSAESGVVIDARNPATPDGINLEGSSYVTVEGFRVVGMPRAGIRSVANHHVVIRDNVADRNASWGILAGFSDDLRIEGNTTSRSRVEHGIYVSNSGDRPVIVNNKSWGNRRAGIHMNGDASMGGDGIISAALVEGNTIHGNGAGGGSAINCDGVQSSRIQNNLIYDTHASGISLFRQDGGGPSSGNVVANNTVLVAADGRWALNLQDGSTGTVVVNNILFNHGPARGSVDASADSLAGLASDHNAVMDRFTTDGGASRLTLARWRSATGQDAHSVVAAPSRLFIAPASDDYHPAATGPAIDAGTPAHAPDRDLEGRPRPSGAGFDIGAYEARPAGATTPEVTRTSPASGATGVPVSTRVTATFNVPVDRSSISFALKSASGRPVPASVAYDPATSTATLTPASALAASTPYTATIGGAADASGRAMTAPFSWTMTTASAAASGTIGLFGAGVDPVATADPDGNPVELGVKFTSDVAGSVAGLRFFKGPGNDGPHVAHLWSGAGKLLASATFVGETASGWQGVAFARPVAIAPGATYVASYFAPAGHYAADPGYFAAAYAAGPLRVPADGGVYGYGPTGRFPSSTTGKGVNYWVDVLFKPGR